MATEDGYTRGSGNTSAEPRFKKRGFLLTLFSIENFDNVKTYLQNLKSCVYYVAARENCPTTGREHIHIYAHFKTPIKLAISKIGGAHVDACRGSPKECINYVKKGGDILEEYGEEPKQGIKMTIKELKETKNPDELPWQMFNTWEKLHKGPKKLTADEWGKKIEVFYICGPSGIGKTQKAKELTNGEPFDLVKHVGEFWHGITDGKGIAIYDEFRPSDLRASEFINFIDYNKQLLNVKGGTVLNQYEKIILTSIFDPLNIYENLPEEAREQWLRRMKIIRLGAQ